MGSVVKRSISLADICAIKKKLNRKKIGVVRIKEREWTKTCQPNKQYKGEKQENRKENLCAWKIVMKTFDNNSTRKYLIYFAWFSVLNALQLSAVLCFNCDKKNSLHTWIFLLAWKCRADNRKKKVQRIKTLTTWEWMTISKNQWQSYIGIH